MTDEAHWLIAAVLFLASAVGLWSAIRRRQLMRRVLRSLTEQQLRDAGILLPGSATPETQVTADTKGDSE
jgi:hypothetical protein